MKGTSENVLEAELKHIMAKYSKPHGVKCAIMYGSRVSGEAAKESDIDVLVVRDGKGLDTLHEFIGDNIIEFVVVGEETLNKMVSESNPYLASVFLSGKPIYNEGYMEEVKRNMTTEPLHKWAEKYYAEGSKKLKESMDKGDVINAATLLLNAYMLAKGELKLSYSIDKLAKRIENTELSKLLDNLLESSKSDATLYAGKIADLVRRTVLGKA